MRKKLKWKSDPDAFKKWCEGKTGVPYVDANMRELLQTGWMSNRGRQNVASFLVKDLCLDWRLGAEWFESLLVSHSVPELPCLNFIKVKLNSLTQTQMNHYLILFPINN